MEEWKGLPVYLDITCPVGNVFRIDSKLIVTHPSINLPKGIHYRMHPLTWTEIKEEEQ